MTELLTIRLDSDYRESKSLVVEFTGLTPIRFNIQHYGGSLISQGQDKVEIIFDEINQFFSEISLEDRYDLYEMYREASEMLSDVTPGGHGYRRNFIRNLVYYTVSALDLMKKLHQFTFIDYILYPDLSNAGEGVGASEDMTFYMEDYRQLTAVVMLCKILVPIWGERAHWNRRFNLEENQIILNNFETIDDLLYNGDFSGLISKLEYFVNNRVDKILSFFDKRKTNTVEVLTEQGSTVEDLKYQILASVLTRRFGTIELVEHVNGKNPNILIAMDSTIKQLVEKKFKS